MGPFPVNLTDLRRVWELASRYQADWGGSSAEEVESMRYVAEVLGEDPAKVTPPEFFRSTYVHTPVWKTRLRLYGNGAYEQYCGLCYYVTGYQLQRAPNTHRSLSLL